MSDYWQKMKAALYKQNKIEEQLESNQQLLDIAKADEQKLGETLKAAVEKKKQKLTTELTTAKAERSRLVTCCAMASCLPQHITFDDSAKETTSQKS